ncbi:syndecan-2-like [Mastacembelus armatus]|uniref:syndecan-2-like n=1 Tax=Mastacembelus armatus TaxID=205130 RepID=UPI000E4631BA|nr:syndecan-2-like [Mastacembelus armatus]
MDVCLTVSLILVWGLIQPGSSSVSKLPEDTEGSGYDFDSSGSGSGDWSEQGETTKISLRSNGRDLTFGSTHWPAEDSELVFMANSKSFLENKQIVAGVIAGGVTGLILAATLMALLIYKWQNKDDGGYIMGQKTHRDEVDV